MQKTSKTEALAALSEWRTAGGGIPEKKHILRAFIDASPDTGEAVAFASVQMLERFALDRDADVDGVVYPKALGMYRTPLFTHPQNDKLAETARGVRDMLSRISPDTLGHSPYQGWIDDLNVALGDAPNEWVEQPSGTFACPICGKNTPHYHAKDRHEAFTHPVTPEGGEVVQWTEAHNAATYLQHHIGEGDEGACNALDTIDKFILSHRVQPDLSISGGAQGLEWSRNRLYFKNKEIGSYHIWPGSVAITFMGGAGARQFEFVDEAKAALELEARTWLSPLSQASGVQREYDLAMKEASDLAMFMWKKFYADDAPNFGLCDTAAGILSQIDNMVTGLVKAPLSQARDTVAVSRETWETACEWLETTFGPIKPERIITRAKEEFAELEEATDLQQQTTEAADVVMCLMRFPGLWDALVAKMKVNRKRTWELRGDGTGYHVKTETASMEGK